MTANVIPLKKPDAKPSISAVMVSYMTGPALLEAVSAVLNDQDILELIIVDNGNTESARRALCNVIANEDRVRLIQGHGNVGFAKASNYGASLAIGDLLLFINPDAIIDEGAARKLADSLAGLKAPFIVGGMLRDINGREQRGGRRRAVTPWRAFTTFTGLHKLGLSQPIHMECEPTPTGSTNVDIVSGAFMMTDRQSFEMLGGFDNSYFLHVEDIDICRRAKQKGGDVVFTPSAVVMHYGSTSKVPRQQVEWMKLKGFIRYFWNYTANPLGKLLTIVFAPAMAVAIMGRAWWLAVRFALVGR